LIFLPANTSSVIQLMVQGIIANFKRHYRSPILSYVLDKGSECRTNPQEVPRSGRSSVVDEEIIRQRIEAHPASSTRRLLRKLGHFQ